MAETISYSRGDSRGEYQENPRSQCRGCPSEGVYENGPANLSVTSGLRQRAEPGHGGIFPRMGLQGVMLAPVNRRLPSCLRTERPWNTTRLKGQHRYKWRPLSNLRQTEGTLQCPDQSESGWTRGTGTGLSCRDRVKSRAVLTGAEGGGGSQGWQSRTLHGCPVLDVGASAPAGQGRGRQRLERWVDEGVTLAHPPRRITDIPTRACVCFTFREDIVSGAFQVALLWEGHLSRPGQQPGRKRGGNKNRMADQTNANTALSAPKQAVSA